MSKYYKLVPVKPTREMWAAAGNAVVALNSQHHDAISEAVYKAMLAAAPDFDRQVIAEVNQSDDGYWADILPDRSVYLGQPLYAVMQPAPDVTELVAALECCMTSMLDAGFNPRCVVIEKCRQALAAYRKQGGDV